MTLLIAASLVGLWVPAAAGPDACASDEAIRYRADGRFADLLERGRWRLRAGVLVETVTLRTEAADRPGPAHATRRYRLAWPGHDRVRLTSAVGRRTVLRRCRDR